MWELDWSWVPKNWCFWTVVLEETLESPLDCKEIQPVHPKENQPWIFFGRTDVEAETAILWPPDVKNLRIWKDPDVGKHWRREPAEGDNRGWDGWMPSLTRWTWIWVNSGSWQWTGRPGALQSMGWQSQTWLSDWSELTELVISRWVLEKVWFSGLTVSLASFTHKHSNSCMFIFTQSHFGYGIKSGCKV